MGIVIGTALVYDIYFSRIPNLVILGGFGGIFLLTAFDDIRLIPGMLICGMAAGIVLFFLYIINAIGAGDVKLLTLICSCVGLADGIRFLILVMFTGGFLGIMKLMLEFSGCIEKGKKITRHLTLKFTVPITICYFAFLISKGDVI